jgi:hypothetical protein
MLLTRTTIENSAYRSVAGARCGHVLRLHTPTMKFGSRRFQSRDNAPFPAGSASGFLQQTRDPDENHRTNLCCRSTAGLLRLPGAAMLLCDLSCCTMRSWRHCGPDTGNVGDKCEGVSDQGRSAPWRTNPTVEYMRRLDTRPQILPGLLRLMFEGDNRAASPLWKYRPT